MVVLRAALDIHDEATIARVRAKSVLLTGCRGAARARAAVPAERSARAL